MRRVAQHSDVREGARAGLQFVLPTLALGISFGVLARPVMGTVAPIVMSMAVFSGAAQFAALSVLAVGGEAGAAIVAGMLMNARWLPMGVAVGPSLPGGALLRAIQGQSLVDASFALASRGDGSFDRGLMAGATLVQWVSWAIGTVVGVAAGPVLGDPARLGLDAVFGAFYLALMPVAPPGLPIIAASVASLLGLRRP